MTDTPPPPAPMADAPAAPSPPSKLDVAKAFVADLARPIALLSASSSMSVATVTISWRVDPTKIDQLAGAAAYIIGGWAAVAALYGVKEWGNVKQAQATADVQKAQAQSGALP